MVELGGWFKKEFWNGAGADGRINTKLITKKLESYLPADPDGVRLEGGLLRGWNVETRDPLARVPLLYGENGKPLYGVNPDAIYAADDGYRALLEIEGGGAVQNNRLIRISSRHSSSQARTTSRSLSRTAFTADRRTSSPST